MRWQKKKLRQLLLRKGTFFWHGDGGEWGFRREGRGGSNLVQFITREESPFQTRQTAYLSSFFTNFILFKDTPSSTSIFAKFLVYFTAGWKFDRKDQTSLCLKIASGRSNSIVFQNSIWYINLVKFSLSKLTTTSLAVKRSTSLAVKRFTGLAVKRSTGLQLSGQAAYELSGHPAVNTISAGSHGTWFI